MLKKHILRGALALLMIATGATAGHAKSDESIKADQLEQCGAYKRVAPWCAEALEVDTRQLQDTQIILVPFTAAVAEKWQKMHKEKRRGIAYTEVNEEGETVKTGRPVLAAVMRVIAIPPSGKTDEALLFQALVKPDMSGVTVFLPADGDFQGWNLYVLSSEGKYALTLSGELFKVSGRHLNDGNLAPDTARLPESLVTSTLLLRRGDGSGAIEALEAAFVDHHIVNDRDLDGNIIRTRVYSGMAGTFTPISEDGTSVVASYSNCRTGGQRVLERGNLRLDTTDLAVGFTAAPKVIQTGFALFGIIGCR
jgi:hypothetical protein